MIWLYLASIVLFSIALILWKNATFHYKYYSTSNMGEGFKLPMPLWLLVLLIISILVPIVNVFISVLSLVVILICVFTGNGGEYDIVDFPDKGVFKIFKVLNKNLND